MFLAKDSVSLLLAFEPAGNGATTLAFVGRQVIGIGGVAGSGEVSWQGALMNKPVCKLQRGSWIKIEHKTDSSSHKKYHEMQAY
jgi:hypothetical protein